MLEIIQNLKKQVIKEKINLDLLLINSFVYDGEFPSSVEKGKNIRKEYIQRNGIDKILNSEFIKLKKIANKKNLSLPGIGIANDNLEIIIILSLIIGDPIWNKIYGLSAKKLSINIDNKDFSDTKIIKTICKLFYQIITKKPFLRFNFSRGLILVNILLQKIGYPPLYIFSNDKKRVYRSIDYYIDFEKEFIITLLSRINKNIYENKYPNKIISAKEKRKKENKFSIYLKPGYWWWGDDGLIYTVTK